jgi:integrase
MSNLLSKLDNESKGIGLTIEGFLEDRLNLSESSHKTAKSALKEIEGYLISQGDTLTSILEGLVQLNNEKKNLAPIIKALLSGFEKYSSKTRMCNNCDGKGFISYVKNFKNNGKIKSVKMNKPKCTACRANKIDQDGIEWKTTIKKPSSYNSRSKNLTNFKELLRFYGLLDTINDKSIKPKREKKVDNLGYALSKEQGKLIVSYAKTTLEKAKWTFLVCSGGGRVDEVNRIQPKDFYFIDSNAEKCSRENMRLIAVTLRGQDTKMKKGRDIFVHEDDNDTILRLMESRKNKPYMFHNNCDSKSAYKSADTEFNNIREAMVADGYEYMSLWNDQHTNHEIKIHTLRSLAITLGNRIGHEFGDMIAGHTDGMRKIYDRMPLKQKMEDWIEAQPWLSFENDNSETITQLQEENVLLKEQITKQQETFEKQINLLEQRAKAREDETNHRLDELSNQFPTMQEAQNQFAQTKRN